MTSPELLLPGGSAARPQGRAGEPAGARADDRRGTPEPGSDGWDGVERRGVDRRAVAQVKSLTDEERARGTAFVMVVDDLPLLADMLVTALRLEGFASIGVEPSSPEMVLHEARRRRPTLALVDLDLGTSAFSGLDLIGPLVELGIEVVVFTQLDDRLLVAAAVEQGAVGSICKSVPRARLVAAVTAAVRHERILPVSEREAMRGELRRHRAEHAARLAPFAGLSRREREVLRGLVEGRSAEAIAEASFVSLATVRTQIRGVLTKLGAASQLQAVSAAVRVGWHGDDPIPLRRYSSTLSLDG